MCSRLVADAPFASYWPVLLILWGVIKIVEHQQARVPSYVPVDARDLDHSPQDQQQRPLAGEQVSQLANREHMHVPSRNTVPTTISTNGPANER